MLVGLIVLAWVFLAIVIPAVALFVLAITRPTLLGSVLRVAVPGACFVLFLYVWWRLACHVVLTRLKSFAKRFGPLPAQVEATLRERE